MSSQYPGESSSEAARAGSAPDLPPGFGAGVPLPPPPPPPLPPRPQVPQPEPDATQQYPTTPQHAVPPVPAPPYAQPQQYAQPSQYGQPEQYAQPQQYGQPQYAPVPPRAPMSRRAKRILWSILITLVTLGLLIAALFITVGILNAQRDPAAQVKEYLDLIASGDAEGASALVDPRSGVGSDEISLLDGPALSGASERIVVERVETLDREDDSATVEAELSLAGQRWKQTFTVDRGENEFVLLHTWELKDPLVATVIVQSMSTAEVGLGAVEVAGVPVELEDYDTVNLAVYPAVYPVTAPGLDKYFSVESGEVTGVPSGSALLMTEESIFVVDPQPTDALETELLALVNARAKACVTIPTNMEDFCPYSLRDDNLAAMSVSEEAKALDYLNGSSFSGTAELTYRRNPTEFYTPTDQTTTMWVSGEFEVVDGKLTVTYD